MRDGRPGDEGTDGPGSFAGRLLEAVPGLVLNSTWIPGSDVVLGEFHSPTEDPRRSVKIWIESEGDPSLAFGGWHTHASIHAVPSDPLGHGFLVNIIKAIFDDEFVLIEEKGQIDGQDVEDAFGLDLREPDAILEYQTDPYRMDTARLLSWTGGKDQAI